MDKTLIDIDYNKWAYRLNSKNKYRFGLKYQEITGEQLKTMLEYFNYKCAYSGKELTKDNLTIDHIFSKKHKGVHAIYNIVPCDKKINQSKNNVNFFSWNKSMEYYFSNKEENILEWIAIAYITWGE